MLPRPAPPAAAAPPVGGGWVCISLGLSWLSFSLRLLGLFVRVCVVSALRLCGFLVVFAEVLVVSLSCGPPLSLSVLSNSFAARSRALIGFVFVMPWSSSSLWSVSVSSVAVRFRGVALVLALFAAVTSSSSSSDVLIGFWALSLSLGTTFVEKNFLKLRLIANIFAFFADAVYFLDHCSADFRYLRVGAFCEHMVVGLSLVSCAAFTFTCFSAGVVPLCEYVVCG